MGAAYLNAPDVHVMQRCIKRHFDSRQMAQKLARTIRKPTGVVAIGSGVLNVYRCKICKGWHIGHK